MTDLLAQMAWVRGLARAMVKDVHRADDLAQDAWVAALEQSPRNANSWKGWFSAVMRNRAHELGRSNARRSERERRAEPSSAQLSPTEVQQRMELHQALGAAVSRLAEPYRSTLIRHHFEGWSLRRIASAEGCGTRAIETRLRRARALLRTDLERRAPADHWLPGLLAFAVPTTAEPLLVAVSILAMIGILIPFLDRSSALEPMGEAPAVEVSIPSPPTAAAPGSELSTLVSLIEPEPLVRALILGSEEKPAFELTLIAKDSKSGALLPGVEFEVHTRDAAGRTIEVLTEMTDGEGSAVFALSIVVEDAWVLGNSARRTHKPLRTALGWGKRPDARAEVSLPFEPLEGFVRGVVLDQARRPVAGVFVDVWDREGFIQDEADAAVQTDENGRFVVAPARAKGADLYLSPRAAGMLATRSFEVDRNAPADAEFDGVELGLAPGRPLLVLVVDKQGRAVPDARVSIWPGRDESTFAKIDRAKYLGLLQYGMTTDADGRSPTVMINDQRWQVGARHPAFEDGLAQSVDQGELMTITLVPGRVVRGVVRDESGGVLPRIPLVVESASEQEKGITGEDGSFFVKAPGSAGEEVRLVFLPLNDFAFNVTGPLVPEIQSQPLEIVLPLGVNLVAQLTYLDGREYDLMTGVQWEVVTGPMARRPGSGDSSHQSWLDARLGAESRRSTPRGGILGSRFFMHLCPPGDYLIRFRGSDGPLGEVRLTTDTPRRKVVVAEDPLVDQRTFAGTVRHAVTGRTIERFWVTGRRFERRDRNAPMKLLVDQVVSSAEGRFSFDGLEPGWWEFRVRSTDELTEWCSGIVSNAELGVEKSVELDDALSGVIRLLLPSGTAASGRMVWFVDGYGAPMSFLSAPDGGPVWEGMTDQTGRIGVAGLPRRLGYQLLVASEVGLPHRFGHGALSLDSAAWDLVLQE